MKTLFDVEEMPTEGKSNEWFTPSRYIEAARAVMGSIDLDPASCAMANQIVKANRYYTKEDDGLKQEWYGRVWLNPPYGRTENMQGSNIGLFTMKLLEDFRAGKVTQAILLSTCKTDTSWFHFLWDYSLCFTDHKIRFHCTHPSDERHPTGSHLWGSLFVYLGHNDAKFIQVFSQFGTIAKRVSIPRPRLSTLPLWESEAS